MGSKRQIVSSTCHDDIDVYPVIAAPVHSSSIFPLRMIAAIAPPTIHHQSIDQPTATFSLLQHTIRIFETFWLETTIPSARESLSLQDMLIAYGHNVRVGQTTIFTVGLLGWAFGQGESDNEHELFICSSKIREMKEFG